jgi:hypothetical protein
LPRKDPFRTLDDPAPADPRPACSVPADPIGAGELMAPAEWLRFGALRVPLRRPGWARRLIVRLVLGWRYDAL